MKIKVPFFGNINKGAFIESDATKGAKIGTDLQLPDGSVPTLAQLAAALGVGVAGAATALRGTLWRLISEIPQNIVNLAGLATNGLIVRKIDGSIITRSLATASSGRITVANSAGEAGNPTVDLASVVTAAGPALFVLTFDVYGRITASSLANLDDLADVVAPTPADGNVLTWVAADTKWKPVAPTGGGGTGGYPAELGYAGII